MTQTAIATTFTLKLELPNIPRLQRLEAEGVPMFPPRLISVNVTIKNGEAKLLYVYQRLKLDGNPYSTTSYETRPLPAGQPGLNVLGNLIPSEDLAAIAPFWPVVVPRSASRRRK